MSKWINVKKKKPDKCDDYLVYDEYGIIFIAHYNIQGWFSKNGRITHYMPLPKAPGGSS